MEFWLSYNNGAEKLRLPVNPESVKLNSGRLYTDVEVQNLGEYTVLGGHKQTEISFSSFFPADYDASYCEYEDVPDPWKCVQLIGHWKESGLPIRLVVTDSPINYAVTIRSFNFDERFGSPGDVYFELDLREYVFIKIRKVAPPKPAAKPGGKSTSKASAKIQRPSPRVVPKTYKVVSGDSLYKIAQKVYGSGSKLNKIYDANKKTIGPDKNKLKIGQTLVIPA